MNRKRVTAPKPREPDEQSSSSSEEEDCGNKKDVKYGKHEKMPVLVSDMYREVEVPKLKEFNAEDIKLDGTIVAVGKRRTGKTWVFRNLMYLMKDKFKAGIVISQTDELNKFWRQYIPKKYIYNKYDPAILEAVFRRQKTIMNDDEKTDEEKEEEARFFILLDDVISDQRLKYDEALMELFVAGRHYKLFCTDHDTVRKGDHAHTPRQHGLLFHDENDPTAAARGAVGGFRELPDQGRLRRGHQPVHRGQRMPRHQHLPRVRGRPTADALLVEGGRPRRV